MADVVQQWIIQTDQAERAAQGVAETVTRSSKQAETAVVGVDQAYQRAGRSAERAMGTTQAALRSATRVAGAFGLGTAAAAAGAERSFVSLAATVISSFAIGGPVLGAITAVAGGIGLLVGQNKQASEATKIHVEDLKRLGDAEARLAELRRTFEFVQGHGRAPTQTEAELLALQEERLGVIKKIVEIEAQAPGLDRAQRQFEQEQLLKTKNDLIQRAERTISLERATTAELRTQKLIRDDIAAQIEAQNAAMIGRATGALGGSESQLASVQGFVRGLRGALTPAQQLAEHLENARAALERNRAILAEYDRLQIFGNATLEESVAKYLRQAQVLEEIVRLLEKANPPKDKSAIDAFLEGPSAEQKVVGFATQASGILQGSLSDAITDGIFNGFENGGDILKSFGEQITRTVIDAMIEATIGDATRSIFKDVFSGILGTTKQFGGLVTRPTVTLLGEREPERVLRDRDLAALLRGAQGGGGGPVTVVVQLKASEITAAGLNEDMVDFMRPGIRQPRSVAEVRQSGW